MTDDQIDAISADIGKSPDHYAFMREFARAILQAATRDAPSADAADEIVPWWKVMELAEKHGKGWSQYSGWAFMNDDDLHAFAQAIAASASKGDGND